MPLMSDAVRKQATAVLSQLPRPVGLVVFTQEMECPTCRDARLLTEEIAGCSDRLSVDVYNLMIDRDKAALYRVDRVPTVCIIGERDYGIRFHGIPAGYEFTTMMNGIKIVSEQDSGLKPETRRRLACLEGKADITVFVTLTCPYCPMAAAMAQRFAVESDKVSASAIDSTEFPHLANLYNVMAVPKTVINRSSSFEGAVPEDRLLEEVVKAVSSEASAAT